MRRKKYAINLWEGPLDAVENIVTALNEPDPRVPANQRFLRGLIEKWMESGRNLGAMLDREPALAKAVTSEWKAFLAPTKDGACLCVVPIPAEPFKLDETAFAVYLFMNLLIHRGSAMLDGPCLKCGKFFIKMSARERVYCTKKCAKDTTAAAATAEKRRRERDADLERAKAAIADWKLKGRRGDCKKFVSRSCRLSLNFLTRAMKNGELDMP